MLQKKSKTTEQIQKEKEYAQSILDKSKAGKKLSFLERNILTINKKRYKK